MWTSQKDDKFDSLSYYTFDFNVTVLQSIPKYPKLETSFKRSINCAHFSLLDVFFTALPQKL